MRQYIILISLILVSLISCNQNKSNQVDYNELERTYNDSIRQDSINREKVFTALGDTVFGGVLYGMNIKQAMAAMKEFQGKLPVGKFGDGFMFSDIHFMDLDMHFTEGDKLPNEEIESLTKSLIYSTNVFWKNKLIIAHWNSYTIEANSLEDIDIVMNNLVNLFVNKFGPCSNRLSSVYDLRFQGPYGEWHFRGNVFARWETSTRGIQISINGEEDPTVREKMERYNKYFYGVEIRFNNKKYDNEISAYVDSIKQIAVNKQKQDSLKSVNAL